MVGCVALQDAILALAPADIITPVPLEHWDVELLTQVGARAEPRPSLLLHAGKPGLQQQSYPCTHPPALCCPPLQSGGLPARFGGFLGATDLFDVALFGLSGGEAELMDAQQRLLLEASFEVGATCMGSLQALLWL